MAEDQETTQVVTGPKIVACARNYLGTGYEFKGRSRLGIDCNGLLIMALLDAGWVPKDPTTLSLKYKNSSIPRAMKQAMMNEFDELSDVSMLKVGDVVTMDPYHPPHSEDRDHYHIAIFTGYDGREYPSIIQLHPTNRKVEEHIYSMEWIEDSVGFWRLKGV